MLRGDKLSHRIMNFSAFQIIKFSACNYRPVSLTSVVCKVMERIVKDNVVEHLNEFNVIRAANMDLLEVALV